MVSRVNPAPATPKPKRSDDPVVARGQDAWERLQEDAPRRRALSRGPADKAKARREQSQTTHRRWWLDVGEALTVGKYTSVSDWAYSAWIAANGFDNLNYKTRQDAVWLVANIEELGELPDGLATPSTIRQWANRRRAMASRRTTGKPGSVTGPVTAGDVAALEKAVSLLREAAQDARRSAETMDAAARLIAKVNVAIKRRGGP
ncbi:hypothetical protein BME24068_02488 [Burkholderia metallica]|nr:hypothetical protein BME24068_02488 [Burkholderia metallica]